MYKIKLEDLKISSIFNPFYLIFFSSIINYIFQINFVNNDWSAFSLFNINYVNDLDGIFLLSGLGMIFGYMLNLLLINKNFINKNFLFINKVKLNNDTKTISILIAIGVILVQYYLGSANLYNLYLGGATPQDVEIAIENSPFGLHGIAMLVAFCGIIIWHFNRLIKNNEFNNKLLFLVLCIYFLSYGKAQGFVYLAISYILEPSSLKSTLKKVSCAALIIACIFLTTRILRNQGSDFNFSIEWLLRIMLGPYFGSPIVNTYYAYSESMWEYGWPIFFISMIPSKLINIKSYLADLPDPTSPLGITGAALLFGGPYFVFIYTVLVTCLSVYMFNKSKLIFSFRLFLPFLMVSCIFSMMYNHFMNLTFFWIPLLFCYIISKRYVHLNK